MALFYQATYFWFPFFHFQRTGLNRNGDRIMEIENKRETFCVPALLLSQYLEQHR